MANNKMITNNWSFKSTAKLFGILFIFWLAIVVFSVLKNVILDDRLERNYFNKVNFSFSGKITGEIEYVIGNDYCEKLQPSAGRKFNIFYLDPIQSSIEDYDPRDTSLEFYCIIKKKRIYIIESTLKKNIEIGDIIKFDGIKDSTYHYKIIHKRRNKKYYTDTVLFARWRPTDIFRQANRKSLVLNFLRKNVPR